ncbi:MAG: hypothetical protein PVG39_02380 [Desulfobacteraceae bacterium]|jgi:hypothetical protein
MDNNILDCLYADFDVKERIGTGNTMYKYIPNEDVIDRMNKVFQGCWDTEVIQKEIIEDQLILELRVYVLDPTTNQKFFQTGFGSHHIARYKSGPNTGKIIDIGNVFKSASAKAIVNACTRWGVGLFKDAMGSGVKENTMPNIPTMSNPTIPDDTTTVANSTGFVPPPAPMPVPEPASQQPVTPPAPQMTAPSPVNPPVPQESSVETTTTFSAPEVPNQPVSADIPIVQTPEVPTPNPAPPVAAPEPNSIPMPPNVPKLPEPAIGQPVNTPAAPAPEPSMAAPDLPFSKNGLDAINISDVQRVAINGILSRNNVEYEALVADAFKENGVDKPVPAQENLSYNEAVIIIKYGNDKYNRNVNK